jgi:hypothetical protein
MEVFGTVAAAIGLTQLCVEVMKGCYNHSGSQDIAADVHRACETIVAEIDKYMPSLSAETRPAALKLQGKLKFVNDRIEERGRRSAWLKLLTLWRQYGEDDERCMLFALQQFLVGSALLEQNYVLRRADTSAEPAVAAALDSVNAGLATLASEIQDGRNMRERTMLSTLNYVQAAIAEFTTKFQAEMQNTSSDLQIAVQHVIQHDSATIRSDLQKTVQDVIRREFSSFRAQLPSSPFLGAPLQSDFGNLKDFLQRLGTSGLISDLEIWEIVWDVVHTLGLFIQAISARSAGYGLAIDELVDVEIIDGKTVVSFCPIVETIWASLGNYAVIGY